MQEEASESARTAGVPRVRARGGHLIVVYVALLLTGLVPAGVLTAIARFTICGISGCSGGGFGRYTDPHATLVLLISAGVVAGVPLGVYAVWRRKVQAAVIAAIVAVVVSLGAGWLIGSDFRGCPRNVDTATCMEESSVP